ADIANYCEIGTVMQAVGALGIDQTREVSLTLATATYADELRKSAALQSGWHHTVATAILAAELGRRCGLRRAETFTAGLLHDIGRIGLMTAYPVEYEAILVSQNAPTDLSEAERNEFGVDSAEAATYLAREWRLPQNLVDIIAHHKDQPGGSLNNAAVVHMACGLADFLGFPAIQNAASPTFEEITSSLPEWIRTPLQSQLPGIKSDILREIGLTDEAEKETAAPQEKAEPDPEHEEQIPTKSRDNRVLMVLGLLAVVIVAVAAVVLLRN